jgi:ADP-ribosylglycohydrolase
MESTPPICDISAAFIGYAIGDAAGVNLEGETGPTNEQLFGGTTYVKGTRLKPAPFGAYSDDTEMTLGVCEFLMKFKDEGGNNFDTVTADDFLESFKNVFTPARIGYGSFKHYANGTKTKEQMQQDNVSKAPISNGALMRCLPFAMLSDKALGYRLAILNTDATHPDPKARAATILMVIAARLYWFGGVPNEELIYNTILCFEDKWGGVDSVYDAETITYLRHVDTLDDYHVAIDVNPITNAVREERRPPIEDLCGPQPLGKFSQIKGHEVRGLDCDAMHTVGCVLYLLKFYRDHTDLLISAMRIGGDVDTVAALALGIAAGRDGVVFRSLKVANDQPWTSFSLSEELYDLLENKAGIESAALNIQDYFRGPNSATATTTATTTTTTTTTNTMDIEEDY